MTTGLPPGTISAPDVDLRAGARGPRRPRMVIVDDEPNVTHLLRSWFELSGWEVLTAGDGVGGVDIAKAFAPDLLVLDLMLPGVGGLEVMRRARSLDPTVAVVIHSARDLEEDRPSALDAGADAYVTKPCSLSRLEGEARHVMSRGRARDGP